MVWPFWVFTRKATTDTGFISILLVREEENHTWCSLVVDGWDGPMWSYLFLEPPYICSKHLFPHPHHLETGPPPCPVRSIYHSVQLHWVRNHGLSQFQSNSTLCVWHNCRLMFVAIAALFWKVFRFKLLRWNSLTSRVILSASLSLLLWSSELWFKVMMMTFLIIMLISIDTTTKFTLGEGKSSF